MGSDRYFDLALRQRVARIDSYQGSIKTVNLRLNVLDQTIGRLDRSRPMHAPRPSPAVGRLRPASISRPTPTLASSRFDEVLTLLNIDIAGRYLFGGAQTESKPVEDAYTRAQRRAAGPGSSRWRASGSWPTSAPTHLGRLDRHQRHRHRHAGRGWRAIRSA